MEGLTFKAISIALIMIFMRVIASLVFIKKLGLIDSILMGLSHSMPLTLLIAMATLAYNAKSIDIVHYYGIYFSRALSSY